MVVSFSYAARLMTPANRTVKQSATVAFDSLFCWMGAMAGPLGT
jgi:hypothetical protein